MTRFTALSLALIGLAGCASPTPTASAGASGGKAVSSSASAAKTPTVVASARAGEIVDPPPAIAPRQVKFTAAQGGSYVSADGKLKATIPPGALSSDSTVSIYPIDTSARPVNSLVPGIRFNINFGGAIVLPGQSITVSSPVDARFMDRMKSFDPAFTPEKYGLSQGEDGAWLMTMAVKGPSLDTPDHPAQAVPAYGLLEYGLLRLPAAAPKKAWRLTDCGDAPADAVPAAEAGAPAPADPGPAAPAAPTAPVAAAAQPAADPASQVSYVEDCSGHVVFDNPASNGYHLLDACGPQPSFDGFAPVEPAPRPTPIPVVRIPVHVSWTSDDPAVAGQSAEACGVHFDLAPSSVMGPQDFITGGDGMATTFNFLGTPFAARALTVVGPENGPILGGTAAAGMGNVELTCPKYSPSLTFHLTAPVAMPATVTVHYTLDGQELTRVVNVPASGTEATDTFYQIVPDDGSHAVDVTRVEVSNELGYVPLATDKPKLVHRNGKYLFEIPIVNIAAKYRL